MKSLSQFINEKILINKNSKYKKHELSLYEKWKQLIPNLEYEEFDEVFYPYNKTFSDIIIYTSSNKVDSLVKKGFDVFKTISYKEIFKYNHMVSVVLDFKQLNEIYEESFDNWTIIVRENKVNIMTVSYINKHTTEVIAVIGIEWK